MPIPPWSPDIFAAAWDFATLAHDGQTYGSRQPGQRISYLNHLGSVAMEVMWALTLTPHTLDGRAFDGNLAVQCTILHDVIEDTPYTYADLAAQFGEAVADGVQALTKNETLPTKREQMQDSLQRIQHQPHEVWLVKLSDRITNLNAPPYYWDLAKKQAYRTEAELIYQALHPAHMALADRLQHKIQTYKRYF